MGGQGSGRYPKKKAAEIVTPPGYIQEVDFGDDRWADWAWRILLPMVAETCHGEVDTMGIAAACEWYSLFREAMATIKSQDVQSMACQRTVATARAAWREFDGIVKRYGLTPFDRQKLAVIVEDVVDDPLEQLSGA